MEGVLRLADKRVEAQRFAATNRKARHDYHVEETLEAGIALRGTEVKSMRAGKVNLRDSFARVESGEVILYNMHVAQYDHGNRWNHDPVRPRKLLLHRGEIRRLIGKTKEQGLTLVPLSVYFSPRGHAKVELAVARGKKHWDKRDDIAKREADRNVRRAVKNKQYDG
ncbi:MAG TPA: SsrA-binding protein SmpB [Firmicutes bacterium]|nr:SsrA-binding protein SmpB [Bacillota bacterium]